MEKKTNLTNSIYQSEFLPIIQSGETQIKKLIQYYALKLKSKFELKNKIEGIIKGVAKRLPISLYDREKYISGLKIMSEKLIRRFYDPVVTQFFMYLTVLATSGVETKGIKNPLELYEYELKNTELVNNIYKNTPKSVWISTKGTPYISNYGKLLKQRQADLAKTITLSGEYDKRPISLWQKAEIDIRYENQMKMLDNLVNSGVQLAYISSHPDCSKRCEKWQGELVSLTQTAGGGQNYNSPKKAFLLGKVDGHNVYSLIDIMNVLDKYGYKNNVICGFNCRHRLISYTGQLPPKEFSKTDIKKEREINAKLRDYERKIRFNKQKALIYNKTSPRLARTYKMVASKLTVEYKAFAEKNGFAWYQYRIQI